MGPTGHFLIGFFESLVCKSIGKNPRQTSLLHCKHAIEVVCFYVDCAKYRKPPADTLFFFFQCCWPWSLSWSILLTKLTHLTEGMLPTDKSTKEQNRYIVSISATYIKLHSYPDTAHIFKNVIYYVIFNQCNSYRCSHPWHVFLQQQRAVP